MVPQRRNSLVAVHKKQNKKTINKPRKRQVFRDRDGGVVQLEEDVVLH